MRTFALIGNPNSGKTTLYNSLTGSNAHVGNWPGVTVEKRVGVYKKLKENVEIIDLPGIYSLSPYTSEEVISRNYILDEHPSCVINIVDATNLQRNLYLTTQLLEIDVPVIVALNMIDEVNEEGKIIDVKKLEERFGVPVVAISALKEQNIDILMQRALEISAKPRKGTLLPIKNKDLIHLINDIRLAFKGQGVDNPLFHAVKLIEKDEIEVKNHPSLLETVSDFEATCIDDKFGNDYEALIADARYSFITEKYDEIVITKSDTNETLKASKADKIDKILTHKWFGIPIFLVIMFLVFHITFSENFLFLKPIFSNLVPSFNQSPWFSGAIYNENGLASPGLLIANLLNGCGEFISNTVSSWLNGAPTWLNGLIVDGVLGGLFAILGFLPQILVLFLFFAILEDSGYMARVAFILDRIFRKFGLSGRAFLPMIMGFGCSVPAMINTRTLSSDKEKEATIRVIPFFSCSAKVPILTACSGAIAVALGLPNPDLITYGMYLLGITMAIITIIFMRNTTMRGKVPPFIMELPSYRRPQFKSLMLNLWDKAKHFISKAFTIILASTIVIWFLSSFKTNWAMCDALLDSEGNFIGYDMSQSILHSIGSLISPLFTPLGFGAQLSQFGWVFAVAAITGLIAKENVVATLGVLAASIGATLGGSEGAESISAIMNVTQITVPGLLAFIAFNMLTIPCFAAVATAKGEIAKGHFRYTILFWLAVSFVTSSLIYGIGSAYEYKTWLGILMTLLLIFLLVATFLIFHLNNKRNPAINDLR